MEHTEDTFLRELRARSVTGVRRVRFRQNRTRLVSLSRDKRTLNVHVCYRRAPKEILDAIAGFLTLSPRSVRHRWAVTALREWPGAVAGLAAARRSRPPVRPRADLCCGTPAQLRFLRQLYARLNRERFGGRLPDDVSIRISDRMRRRYGHARLETSSRDRRVLELALNADLFLEGNERELLDTLLHEMAHAEAFLVWGHRGHGAAWKRVAERVGCEPKACTARRIRRRRRGEAPVARVPVGVPLTARRAGLEAAARSKG
ncbi:MAG TPA: SprT family zinc-dependent metalloprotease [Longimicrobiales bacterium]|nr:SprT family zinc-dependent metalloprotease [Longimicrobiales bacterium]